jgi:hypothetical protein
MLYWANSFLASGKYGIYAEIGNDLVLERGYTGAARYFVPYILHLSLSRKGQTFYTNVTGQNITVLLAAGTYTLTLPGSASADSTLLINGAVIPHPSWTATDSHGEVDVSVSVYCGSAYFYLTVLLPSAVQLNDTGITVIQTG